MRKVRAKKLRKLASEFWAKHPADMDPHVTLGTIINRTKDFYKAAKRRFGI